MVYRVASNDLDRVTNVAALLNTNVGAGSLALTFFSLSAV